METVIGNDCWIGDDVMVLGGASISDGCIIGARSMLVEGQITEPFCIYAGSPAKLIRPRFPEAVTRLLMKLRYWDRPLSWIQENKAIFEADLSKDEAFAAAALGKLIENG